jgi:nucleotide-binding universal stress UspA family protein
MRMLKMLVPLDGSESSIRAVDHLIKKFGWYKDGVEIHLLNVQHPFPAHVASHLGHDKVQQYHREQGLAALADARKKLDAAGIKYHYHIGIGDEAEVICKYAKEKGVVQIFMGTRGLGSVSGLLLGSVATKVIHLTDAPVLLVK